MILDDRLEFFDGLVIPAAGTAVVGDQIDLEVERDIGQGQPIYWYVALETPAEAGTSIQFQLITDEAADMAAPTVLVSSAVIPLADLNAGKMPVMMALPAEGISYERYLACRIVVAGDFTAGTISSGLTLDKAGYRSYPQGVN